jgi:hypothetical protein
VLTSTVFPENSALVGFAIIPGELQDAGPPQETLITRHSPRGSGHRSLGAGIHTAVVNLTREQCSLLGSVFCVSASGLQYCCLCTKRITCLTSPSEYLTVFRAGWRGLTLGTTFSNSFSPLGLSRIATVDEATSNCPLLSTHSWSFSWASRILKPRWNIRSDVDWRPPIWSSGQSFWVQIQRSRFDSQRYQIFWEVVSLEQGPLSLVRIIEELLEKTVAASVYKTEINGHGDSLRWPRDILYPLKLALTSPTSGGRSVGIVRWRTEAPEFVCFMDVCEHVDSDQGLTSLAPTRSPDHTLLMKWLNLIYCPQYYTMLHILVTFGVHDTTVHNTQWLQWILWVHAVWCPLPSNTTEYNAYTRDATIISDIWNQPLNTLEWRNTSRTFHIEIFLEASTPFYRLGMFWKFL